MPEDRIQDEPERPRRDDEERPRRRSRRDLDEEDERRERRIARRDEEDDGGFNTLIPYKNPKALIAYYLGVFSLIPFIGVLLAIASITLGVLGLKYRKTHTKAGGTGHAWAGIILGSLVLVGHLVVAILIGIAFKTG